MNPPPARWTLRRVLLLLGLLVNVALLVVLARYLGAHLSGPYPDVSPEGNGQSYGLEGAWANAVGASLAIAALLGFIGIAASSVLADKRRISAKARRVVCAVSAWALANVFLAFVLGAIFYHVFYKRG
jgi:membrane associated rhomboid family serine protease